MDRSIEDFERKSSSSHIQFVCLMPRSSLSETHRGWKSNFSALMRLAQSSLGEEEQILQDLHQFYSFHPNIKASHKNYFESTIPKMLHIIFGNDRTYTLIEKKMLPLNRGWGTLTHSNLSDSHDLKINYMYINLIKLKVLEPGK